MSLRAVGLALLAAAVTGCGSVSASVIDLRHDTGVICRRTNKAFNLLPALPRQSQTTAFLNAGIARLRTELKQLRRVAPPQNVADVYQAALAAQGQELVDLRSAVQAIERGEDPAIAVRQLGHQLGPLQNQANNAWQALEMADCLQ